MGNLLFKNCFTQNETRYRSSLLDPLNCDDPYSSSEFYLNNELLEIQKKLQHLSLTNFQNINLLGKY